jgi:cation diffusion facilitator family transporter
MLNKSKISAKRTLFTSLVVDFLDIVINLAVAIITGSVVMLAETIHGVADFISVLFVIIGLKDSSKLSTKKHPFGHGRALYVWIFLSTIIMLIFTSGLSVYFGLKEVLNPEPINNILIALIVLILFIFTNGYAFSVSSRRLLNGKSYSKLISEFKKSEFLETKIPVLLDFVGTLAAIIGLTALFLYKLTNNLIFDGLGAIAIGSTIFLITLFLLSETKTFLIGKSASQKTQEKSEELF